jgi:transposase InsO family protein
MRGIHMRLLRFDPPINMNIKKIKRLMKKYDLKCPIRKANPYRRMAKAMKTNNYAKNILDRNFTGLGPRKALLTDITYIPFKDHFIYLSPILDACTKESLAHQTSLSLKEEFVKATLDELRNKHGNELTSETLIHSDQGCHYTSRLFINTIEEMNLIRSMSRRGNCWDNAPQESFFGHMKDEIGDKIAACETDEEVITVIDEWFDYYNNDRPIWGLGKRTPIEYYKYLKSGGEIIVPKKYVKKKK